MISHYFWSQDTCTLALSLATRACRLSEFRRVDWPETAYIRVFDAEGKLEAILTAAAVREPTNRPTSSTISGPYFERLVTVAVIAIRYPESAQYVH